MSTPSSARPPAHRSEPPPNSSSKMLVSNLDDALRRVQLVERERSLLGAQVAFLRAEIQLLRAQEASAREERDRLLEHQRGRAWPALLRLRTARERLIPRDTRRRSSYELLSGMRWWAAPAELPTRRDVRLDRAVRPIVSVIIPAHNHRAVTEQCIRSIAAHEPDAPFEVVVVDDCSTDDTATLDDIDGLRVLSLPENVGFLHAVNAGIAATSAPFVLLLNNDCEVTPGWLDALLRVATADDRVGIVGAKLVYPDGSLQEAGGTVFADGSAWNYGRHDDPSRPEYNFVRDVDYVSGAALLVRRSLLDDVGGLDERFAPAYYEDVDLALSARARGLRVVYQPESVILHHEGVSHGTSVAAGVKRFQERNRAVLVDKWADVLADQPAPGTPIGVARTSRPRLRVFAVDHLVPRPDQDAGSVRFSALLNELRELGCAVTFVPCDRGYEEHYVMALQRQGIEVLWGGFEAVQSIRDRQPHVCIASRPEVAVSWIRDFRIGAPDATVLYDTVDLHFVRAARAREEGIHDGSASDLYRELELSLARAADITVAVTEDERETLLSLLPDLDVAVLPMTHALQPPGPGPRDRRDLLFVGGYQHPPNVDAVKYLAAEIMPRLVERLPGVRAILVGSNPPPEVVGLASEHILVPGWVADLEPLLRRCRVSIAPLRYGAGMKGKIGEALSYGLPVVTTTIGAEGLQLVDGVHARIADDPEAFVEAIIELHTDDDLWQAMAEAGREHVRIELSPARTRQLLDQLLDRIERRRRARLAST